MRHTAGLSGHCRAVCLRSVRCSVCTGTVMPIDQAAVIEDPLETLLGSGAVKTPLGCLQPKPGLTGAQCQPLASKPEQKQRDRHTDRQSDELDHHLTSSAAQQSLSVPLNVEAAGLLLCFLLRKAHPLYRLTGQDRHGAQCCPLCSTACGITLLWPITKPLPKLNPLPIQFITAHHLHRVADAR